MAWKNRKSVVTTERVEPDEAAQLIKLLDERQRREVAVKRAQIAFETAALDYQELEQRVSKKYKLVQNDRIMPDGTIVRVQ